MSTMLETYDTHMPADYPIDIDMHQPVELWFDAEAKMEDDATLENHFTDHDTLSVEVDMEDHYGENEYEMADGEGEEIYEEMSSDLLDIEVYDASEPLEEDATIPLAEHVNPLDSHSFDIESSATAKPLLLPVAITPAMSPLLPPDTELPDALAVEHVEGDYEEPVDEENVDTQQAADPPAEVVIPLPVDEEENVEATDEFQNHESGQVQEQIETGNTDVAHHEEHHQPSDTTTSDDRDVEEPVEEAVVVDPHQISEGIWIDPPPAVLVSFESSDFSDVCLFNQPARSRSPSPSAEGHGQGYQVFTLLLQHRPILYYEPLASVFEALRQEEYLARIPHFADSELVLDAYDLQLVISEDNVYAREVTLHDLNVLHDGSDITGPLRLRLKSVIPRFILRYHLLQDQVARLNLAAAGDEQEPSAESNDPEQQDQERASSHQNDDPENAEEQASETTSALPSSAPNENPNENPADPPNLNPSHEDQRGESTEEQEVTAVATETSLQHSESVHETVEENAEAESPAVGESGGDGERLQPDGVDAEAEGLPDLPDDDADDAEEEEEEEAFVVVETPGSKPIIPLTGTAAAEDIEPEKPPVQPLPLSSGSGPSNPKIPNPDAESETNVNAEDLAGSLANNSVDVSAHDGAAYEGESYDEGEAQWEDDADPDTTWEVEEQETASNESSVTLSSKASKRSFDEVELEEDEADGNSPPGSPGAKRTRVD
ncbi:hypothetical protein C8R44DRAFT_890935 [Mycena epipterygia]|nr:hypothetical protein C8R44DRAFT_890935 [Mycena epipterygia]